MNLKQAKAMNEYYSNAWEETYRFAREDQQFYLGDQWPVEAKADRDRTKRPALTVNLLPQFVHQVTNQNRQNTPSINVIPSDTQTSEKAADYIKGLMRKIEYTSGADEIYDTASFYSVISAIGFIRVDHRYVKEEGGEQEIFLRRVQNPLSCWIDPASVECDARDAKGCIILDNITRDEFEARYGKSKQFISFDSREMKEDDKDTIVIAEIFKREKDKMTRCIFSGADKLESGEWPSPYIPLIPVFGEEVWNNGKRHLLSLIRNAKDAQRRYNHWVSVEAEMLNKAPKAPIIAEAGTIEDFADEWASGNADVLRWNARDINGNPASMRPQRMEPISVQSAIMQGKLDAYEDVKRCLGLYDASVGQKSNETSGIAIEARQAQGDNATYHFIDNLSRAITQVGRVIISMLPTIYDTPRIVSIIDKEENQQFIGLNGKTVEGQAEAIDLANAAFDVRVTTGASYLTLKQEATVKMGEILAAQPQMMGVFGDIWAKNLDIPDNDVLADRIKATIPPQILQATQKDDQGNAPDPEKQMMMQQIDQLTQQLQQIAPIVEGKQAELQMKAQEVQGSQAAKSAELSLKEQEMQMKYALEQEKLRLEAQKLELERQKIAIGAIDKQEERALKLDTTGFQFSRTPEEEARLAMEAEMKALQEEESAAREAEEKALEAEEKAIERQERMAVIQALMSISEGVAALNQRVGQPMSVVRDSNGQIVGAAPTGVN